MLTRPQQHPRQSSAVPRRSEHTYRTQLLLLRAHHTLLFFLNLILSQFQLFEMLLRVKTKRPFAFFFCDSLLYHCPFDPLVNKSDMRMHDGCSPISRFRFYSYGDARSAFYLPLKVKSAGPPSVSLTTAMFGLEVMFGLTPFGCFQAYLWSWPVMVQFLLHSRAEVKAAAAK